MLLPIKKDTRLIHLPIGLIHPSPFQPRRAFEDDELQNLADSIRKNGLLQPLSVRRLENGSYELIAGERRLRACRIAGLKEVSCLVHSADDRRSAVLGLLENIQRQDLNIFEEAEGIAMLMNEWGLSQYEIACHLGKAQSTIANKLRLLRLPTQERGRILAARLTERHARALLRIADDRLRADALNTVIARQLCVSETEEMVERLLSSSQTPAAEVKRIPVIRDYRIYVNTLTKAVDSIRKSGLDARSDETETEEFIRYTVIIPKTPSVSPSVK